MELTKKAAIPKKNQPGFLFFDDVSINVITSTAATSKIVSKKIKLELGM